jgi:hypothetical protein
MEVLAEFNPAYSGPPSEAVWIIGTPSNRAWFEVHAESIDSNSATFDDDVPPVTVISHVFAHHPDWTEIVVRGAALTGEIEDSIAADADVACREDDSFRLRRR